MILSDIYSIGKQIFLFQLVNISLSNQHLGDMFWKKLQVLRLVMDHPMRGAQDAALVRLQVVESVRIVRAIFVGDN